jgi:hypothetical protein
MGPYGGGPMFDYGGYEYHGTELHLQLLGQGGTLVPAPDWACTHPPYPAVATEQYQSHDYGNEV